MQDGRLERVSPGEILQLWQDFTGVPVVTVSRTYTQANDAGAFAWLNASGEMRGHVSWAVDGDTAEIVTIEARDQGVHIGGRLLDAAESEIHARGAKRIIVTTTNDNIRAQAFYLRRGYRLARIEHGGMKRVRLLKPGVPETGHEGLQLVDMWEFEKLLR